jgi:hypothetical protein
MTERFSRPAKSFSKSLFRSSTWEEVTATVISSTYHYARLRDLSSEDFQDNSFFLVSFSYTVNGELFVDEYKRSDSLEAGHQIVIRYDPFESRAKQLNRP